MRNENNEWLPMRNVYGFCDGKVIWISRNSSYFPLIKQGNTFEFIAYPNSFRDKETGHPIYVQGSPGLSLGLSVASILNNYTGNHYMGEYLFQMNIDNGQFY